MTPAALGDLKSLPLRTAPHPLYSNYEASNYLLSWLSPAGTRSPATRKRAGRSLRAGPQRGPFAGAAQPRERRGGAPPGALLAATPSASAGRGSPRRDECRPGSPPSHPPPPPPPPPPRGPPCPLLSHSRGPGPPGSRGSLPHPQVRAPLGRARWRRPRRARRADGTPRAPGRDWPGGEGRRAEKMAPPPAAAPRSGAC